MAESHLLLRIQYSRIGLRIRNEISFDTKMVFRSAPQVLVLFRGPDATILDNIEDHAPEGVSSAHTRTAGSRCRSESDSSLGEAIGPFKRPLSKDGVGDNCPGERCRQQCQRASRYDSN
jgi:hypothetical protein